MKDSLTENNMAKFAMINGRLIKTNIWQDDYFFDLNLIEKFLFLYIITNDEVNIAGIYQIGTPRISQQTGIDREDIKKAINKIQQSGKIYYIDGWIFISKFIIHQNVENLNIRKGVIRVIKKIPEEVIKKIMPLGLESSLKYMKKFSQEDSQEIEELLINSPKDLYETSSDSLVTPTTKLNLTKLNSKEIYTDILEFWNSKKICIHKTIGDKTKKNINNLLKEFSLEEIKKGITNYSDILHSEKTYFKYKWTLEEFIQRQNGLRVFIHKTVEDYKKNENSKDEKSEGDRWI